MTGRAEVSRRDALRMIGGAVTASCVARASAADNPSDPGIIDTHIHTVAARFLGSRPGPTPVRLAPFDRAKDPDGLARLAKLVSDQMKAAGVEQALGMPTTDVSDADPLGIRETLALAELLDGPRLHAVGVMHPERFDRGHLAKVEEVLDEGQVKALKAYLGYEPYEPDGAGYRPYYKLAAKYKVPVILHTGDTWSRRARVRYAHPLKADDLAVDYPDTKFVLAHFGTPWNMDAAEVLFKNENVWADLSAFLVGDAKGFAQMEKDGVMTREAERLRQGLDYVESYDKFLFGTDWPLCPMGAYRDFIRKLIPERHQRAVFRDNAVALYKL